MVVHVSGKRMIESGVDGISRGDMNAGMMVGQSVYAFIPLHLSAEEQSPKLVNWIKEWAEKGAKLLNPNWWPDLKAAKGTYIWTPPPAAADAMVDWLGESVHKRSSSVHIVAVSRLMTACWRKILGKIGDLQVEIPCGVDVWPANGDARTSSSHRLTSSLKILQWNWNLAVQEFPKDPWTWSYPASHVEK